MENIVRVALKPEFFRPMTKQQKAAKQRWKNISSGLQVLSLLMVVGGTAFLSHKAYSSYSKSDNEKK